MLRQDSHAALTRSKNRFSDAVHDQVGIAADGRREMGVAGRGQRKVAFVLFAVARLAQRTEHEVGKDPLLRLAGYLERQLLIHARGHGDILCDLILSRLLTAARTAASLLTALRLHGYPFHRQSTQAEGVTKGSRHGFELG